MSIKVVSETGEILPAPRNLPSTLFEDFERQDEDQILAELKGQVIEEFVYRFTSGGQTVMGLSLAGVMNVAQRMGGITCGAPVWERSEEEITCDISATDHKTGLTVWGTASAPLLMHGRNGDTPDKFARAKALSKAQRNAIRKIIPEALATRMLKLFLEQQGGGQRASEQSRAVEAPKRQSRRAGPEPEAIEAEASVTGDPGLHARSLRKLEALCDDYTRAGGLAEHYLKWTETKVGRRDLSLLSVEQMTELAEGIKRWTAALTPPAEPSDPDPDLEAAADVAWGETGAAHDH